MNCLFKGNKKGKEAKYICGKYKEVDFFCFDI